MGITLRSGCNLLVAFCFLALSACSRAEQPKVQFAIPKEQPVKATLIAKHSAIRLGTATRVGVLFEMQSGWHIYAKDPGDAGIPTKVQWIAQGWQLFGPIQWPTPQDFLDAGDIHTHGYTGIVVLRSDLSSKTGAKRAPAAEEPVRAHVEWLACHEICLPGSADLELAIPITVEEPKLSAHAEAFDQVNP